MIWINVSTHTRHLQALAQYLGTGPEETQGSPEKSRSGDLNSYLNRISVFGGGSLESSPSLGPGAFEQSRA